ncbi:uncharacterized protein B0I36DRAFT_333264 [Microdochium trichocladiopsis]|uniref:Uncharacterized protein n=1 Tax=Microdochium trichocladiopsis TaxID=1682393 RepID=A0A9P8XVS2_9PEZI|nr:uncharacterized protein B0I36DRAFT_333264 [Microdochium trichocladiopsis]KAH7020841.1 hypothetical protein B0I36DRAFT_333264 [Microdochium trichocladiopsis]
MQDYRAALDEARNRLDSLGFTTPSQLHRQHRIANASASALAALLSSTAAGAAAALTTPGQRQGRGQEQQQEQQQPLGMPRSDLTTFARAMAPLVMANVQDAAAIQLDSINARVHAWRAALGPERWRELRVVVTTGHMPRAGFLPGQYFERMLRENGRTGRTGRTRGSCGGSGDNGGTGADGRGRGDGGEEEVPEKRLFYMEVARPDVAGVLDFLGTHVVDGKAGVEFFGDAGRLHRDILADAAARYLDGMDLPPWP